MMRAWRTPTDDSRRGGAQTPEKRLAGNHTVNLADQALGWPTPKASDGSKPSAGKRRDADLDHRARLWPTPNVPNGGGVNPPGTSTTGQAPDGSKKQIGLDEVARGSAQRWMTPSAWDWRSREAREKTLSRNSRPPKKQEYGRTYSLSLASPLLGLKSKIRMITTFTNGIIDR